MIICSDLPSIFLAVIRRHSRRMCYKLFFISFIYDSLCILFLISLNILLVKTTYGVTCSIHPRKMLKLAHSLMFKQYPDCSSTMKMCVLLSKKNDIFFSWKNLSICPEETFLSKKRIFVLIFHLFFSSYLNTFWNEHKKCMKSTFYFLLF